MSKNVQCCFAVFLMAAESVLAVNSRVPIAPNALVQRNRVSSVSLNPTSIIGGGTVTGTVTLAASATSAGVMLNITSSAPNIAAVPASVVVQPGARSATFIVQTAPVVVNPNVVNVHAPSPGADISVRIDNGAATVARLTILPPILATLTLNPRAIPGGGSSTGTVTISGAAPTGGIGIALSAKTVTPEAAPIGGGAIALSKKTATSASRTFTSSGPVSARTTVVTLPSQVVIPAGSTTASFSLTTTPVAAITTYEIDAVQGAFITKNAALTLQPPPLPTPNKVTLSPWGAIGGTPVTVTVSLTAPAPQGGITFPVSIAGAMSCGPNPTGPASVQIAGGASSGTFSINTYPAMGTVGIWVNGGAGPPNDAVADLVIVTPASSLQFTTSVKGGTTVPAKLHLNGAALPSSCNGQYMLKSSNTQLARVPDSVVVTPGTSDAAFSITTSGVPSSQNVTISINLVSSYGISDSTDKTLTLTP